MYTPTKLIEDQPLLILPSLAAEIGLNEAIVLQQLHFRLRISQHQFDGRTWYYNTIENWQRDNFPFWSIRTVRRIFATLEEQGLIESTDIYNPEVFDHTKWYTISYDHDVFALPERLDDVDNLATSRLGQSVTGPVDKLATSSIGKEGSTKTSTKERAHTSTAPWGFEEWWAIYPRHENRNRAEKAWAKIDPELIGTIMRETRRQIKDNHFGSEEFVPHGATWLNNRRWEDEPIVKKGTQSDWDWAKQYLDETDDPEALDFDYDSMSDPKSADYQPEPIEAEFSAAPYRINQGEWPAVDVRDASELDANRDDDQWDEREDGR